MLNTQHIERLITDMVKLKNAIIDIDHIGYLNEFRAFLEHDVQAARLVDLADSRQAQFDLFDVLSIHHFEAIHSNMLAWLFDPQQNHGLESRFLREFLSRTGVAAQEIDWTGTEVRREWRYIDIMILNRKAGFVCAIENKVWAEEGIGADGKSQVAWYRDTLDIEFPRFNKHLVFLSPGGMDSRSIEEREHWITESYASVLEAIADTLDNAEDLNQEIRWFISQYEGTLRRHVLAESSEIGALAREIYLEHRDTIELLIRHKPNYAADIKQIVREAICEQDGWCLDAEAGHYIRFRSKRWDEFAVSRTGTGWRDSQSLLLFEFYCPNNPIHTGAACLSMSGGDNGVIRERLFEAAKQNPRVFRPRHTALLEGFTMLNEYKWNILEEADLGKRWADGSTRNKLMEWIKHYAETEFVTIDNAIVQCFAEYEQLN